MMATDVNERESKLLFKDVCPDCEGDSWQVGPRRGIAQDIECENCGSEFNIAWPAIPQRTYRKVTPKLIKEITRFDLIDMEG